MKDDYVCTHCYSLMIANPKFRAFVRLKDCWLPTEQNFPTFSWFYLSVYDFFLDFI